MKISIPAGSLVRCIAFLAAAVFFITAPGPASGQGVSVFKKSGPPATSTVVDIDSITYSTDVAPTMRVHQQKNGFSCDLAGIDSIKFGAIALWEIAATGDYSYQILKSRQSNMNISLGGWGPNWGWMGMSGTESVSSANVRTVQGTNPISNSAAHLIVNHTAFLSTPQELTLSFDLSVDSSVNGAYIIAGFTLDGASYGKGSVQAFAKGAVAATVGTSFPLGAGGLSGDFDSLRVISNSGDTSMVLFDRLVTIACDNGARFRLIGDATKGTPYKTGIRIRLPGPALFYPRKA
jgi:hypothetical protein